MKKSSQNKEGEIKEVSVIVEEKTKGLQKMLAESLVRNDQDLSGVSDKIKGVKSFQKYVEQQMDQLVAPAKAIIAKAKETYEPAIKECKNAEITLKERAKKYLDDKAKKVEVKKEKIAEESASGKISDVQAVKQWEKLPTVQTNIRTPDSGLRLSKRFVAVITNPSLIPDEYWEINEVRVRRDALERNKNGMVQIPGVEIREETSVSSV